MAHDVFLSHSVKDKAVADAIVARLEAESVTCWVAPRDVMPGADWGESIINAIESSRIMILIFSKNANASPQIKREVERAVDKEVYIIPFRVDNIAPTRALEYFISTAQWLDAFSPPLERHLDNLAKTVKAVLANPPLPKPLDIEAPVNPPLPETLDIEAPVTPVGRAGAGGRWVDRLYRMAIIATIPTLVILGAAGWYLGQKREVRLEKSSRLVQTENQGAVAKPAEDEADKKKPKPIATQPQDQAANDAFLKKTLEGIHRLSTFGRYYSTIHVGELTPKIARQLDLPNDVLGVVVTSIDPIDPDGRAGLAADLQKGDIIEKINYRPITSISDLYDAHVDAGQSQVLSICRHRIRSFVILPAIFNLRG